jgi:hypothetical protein
MRNWSVMNSSPSVARRRSRIAPARSRSRMSCVAVSTSKQACLSQSSDDWCTVWNRSSSWCAISSGVFWSESSSSVRRYRS